MKDEEAESKKKIEDAFASAGLKVPALQEVIAGLKVDKVRAHKIVTLLLRDKVLIKVSDELVFHRSALEQLRRQMTAYKAKSAKIDVAKFKELTGVTRKYAIPLLEYLDRERVTKRVGDARNSLRLSHRAIGNWAIENLNPIAHLLSSSDLFFREFQFQAQGVGHAVGEVGEAGQHVDIDDLGLGEMLLQFVEVRLRDLMRGSRQLLDVSQRGPLFLRIARVVS